MLPRQILRETRSVRWVTTNAASTTVRALDFSDGRAVYAKKDTKDLVRAYLVLRLCGVRSLVDHAAGLLSTAERVLGRSFVKELLRQSFFGHFCAGESEDGIRPTVEALDRAGVGSILDYAAEVKLLQSTTI